MPRRDLMLADKIALLDQIESLPPGTSNRQVSEITGVPKSTLARVIRNRDALRQQWALRPGSHQRRRRFGKNPDVEEALNTWFATVTELGVPVSGPMIKCMSEELAKQMGHEDFKATDGWVSRWKVRNSIRLKKSPEEKDVSCAEQTTASKQPLLMQKYRADNIYCVGETGLFYLAVPDGALKFTLSSSLSATNQLTILCCCNMSGNNKRKLLVVGKGSECTCFERLRMDGLPVVYRSEENSMMTSSIFQRWLMDWDEELQLESRKILLFLNRCVAHPQLYSLRNIKLEFLPSDTFTLKQPMDMGILKKLKMLYREKLVHCALEGIEDGVLTSSSTAEEVSSRIDLLQAMQFLADSWRKIDNKTIQNCFLQSGFKHPGLEMFCMPVEGESECFLYLQSVQNYEEFERIDDELQCYYEDEEDFEASTTEPATLQSKDKDASKVQRVTDRDARECIAQLRLYFMQEGNEDSPVSSLDKCADFVHSMSIKRRRQSKLTRQKLTQEYIH